jgi:hypothetical protein
MPITPDVLWGAAGGLIGTLCLYIGSWAHENFYVAPFLLDKEKQGELDDERKAREKAEQALRDREAKQSPILEEKIRKRLENTIYLVQDLIEHIVDFGPTSVDSPDVENRFGGKGIVDMAQEARLIVVRDGKCDLPDRYKAILSRIIYEYTKDR